MELWRDQIHDFLQEFVQVPAVIVGNSIGSLATLMVAAEHPGAVRGVALLNCCGAMNNKACQRGVWGMESVGRDV